MTDEEKRLYKDAEQRLLNAIAQDPNKGFSEFNWQPVRRYGWGSTKHLNLNESRGRCPYQTRITKGNEQENAIFLDKNGERKAILSYWGEAQGEPFPYRRLFELYEVGLPSLNPEEAKKQQKIKDDTEKLLLKIKADFLGDEGAEVRKYLATPRPEGGRGYDPATIKAMADFMGVLTPETTKQLQELAGLKFESNMYQKRPLFMLTLNKWNVIKYAKFRSIDPSIKDSALKWRNTSNEITTLFNFNHTSFLSKFNQDYVVLVESEICAIHATIKGVKNVVSTQGAKGISEEQIRTLSSYKCKKVILLYDTDTRGYEAIDTVIKQILPTSLQLSIAHIPESYEAKDPDDLLTMYTNGAELLQQVIDNALTATEWLAQRFIDNYRNARTTSEKEAIQEEVINVLAYLYEIEKDIIADTIRYDFSVNSGVKVTPETFERVAQRKAEEEKMKIYEDEQERLVNEVLRAHKANDEKATKEAVEELNELRKPYNDPELKKDDNKTMTEAFKELYRDSSKNIKTSYSLFMCSYDNEIVQQPLTLYANGISYFAGGTGHGKSTILQNIAVDLLTQGKRVLYYSFEESKTDTLLELLNIYIHKETAGGNIYNLSSKGNITAINDFFKEQDPEVFDNIESEKERINIGDIIRAFFQNFRGIAEGTKTLYIFDDSLTSSELVEHVKDNITKTLPDAIFIDYVQFLNSAENVKKAQYEDLGEVSKDLIKINKAVEVPLVVAAQLREKNNEKVTKATATPDELRYTDIQGASTIAQGASAVYLIANSTKYTEQSKVMYFDPLEVPQTDKSGNVIGRTIVPNTPFGQQGLFYIKLDKNRYGVSPAYAMYQYNGSQRFIDPKKLQKPKTFETQTPTPQTTETDEDNPF